MGQIKVRVTGRLVAQEAGPGITAVDVSRYCNRQPLSKEKEEMIAPVVEKYGYRPDPTLQAIGRCRAKRSKTYRLGFLASFSSDLYLKDYHRKLAGGVTRAVESSSRYITQSIKLRDEQYLNIRQVVYRNNVDGLFVLTWRSHLPLIHLLETSPSAIPPVMLFNDYDPDIQANFVYCNVRKGVRMAVDHLVKLRKKKIAYIGGPRKHQSKLLDENVMSIQAIDPREKYEGFKEGMKSNGVEIRKDWVRECKAYTTEEGVVEAQTLFNQTELPEAVICGNDEIALGVLEMLNEKGIKCPAQVCVIGFDGIDEGIRGIDDRQRVRPTLTTVAQPLLEMGEFAGHKLIEFIEGKHKHPIHQEFQPILIFRGSCPERLSGRAGEII